MELNSALFADWLDADIAKAQAQRRDFSPWAMPLVWSPTLILDDTSMRIFKKRVGIFKICEIFGIRDDSWLTIRRMNDMRFLKKFWLLEEKNWKYLDEVISICNEKWVELYWTEILKDIWYKLPEEVKEPDKYAPVDIKQIMAPVVDEVPEDTVKNQWDMVTKKMEKDMSIDMVDLDLLETTDLKDVQTIYKRVTWKGISPNFRNNKQWFIDQLTKLKNTK